MYFTHLPLRSAKDIKHKISFLLQKPEPQTADQKQIKDKTPVAAAKRSDELLCVCAQFKIFALVYSLDPTSHALWSSKRQFHYIQKCSNFNLCSIPNHL